MQDHNKLEFDSSTARQILESNVHRFASGDGQVSIEKALEAREYRGPRSGLTFVYFRTVDGNIYKLDLLSYTIADLNECTAKQQIIQRRLATSGTNGIVVCRQGFTYATDEQGDQGQHIVKETETPLVQAVLGLEIGGVNTSFGHMFGDMVESDAVTMLADFEAVMARYGQSEFQNY